MSIMQMFLGAGGGAASMAATGGDSVVTTTIGGTSYKVHTFLSDGTFTVTAGGNIDALLVGGGGGGGHYGGGGGGGCVIHVQSKTLTAGSYSIVVGDGGAYTARTEASDAITSANDGESTTFNGYTATGGGAGGAYNSQSARAGANAGGSGAYITSTVDGVAPSSVDAYDTVYAGYTGGHFNYGSPNYPGGGGAGAGEDGAIPTGGSDAAAGGDGVQINIDGNNSYWGGGGGGGNYANAGGTGGNGGGGNGGSGSEDGDANTGGGGGGGTWAEGAGGTTGVGGSGIVIIRYEA